MSELSQNKSTVQSTPSDATLQHCCKLSIMEDKPIMLDYWNDSIENKALIGVKNNEEQYDGE